MAGMVLSRENQQCPKSLSVSPPPMRFDRVCGITKEQWQSDNQNTLLSPGAPNRAFAH